MKAPTVRSIRTISIVVFLLSFFFLTFFDNSKHLPLLAAVNPFADDPYDAVGSFGVQLSFFTALLSLFRAFRPYATEEIRSRQQLLILRGETVVLLSILVTLTADLVAMLRYVSMWKNSPAGWILTGNLVGLILLTTLAGLLLYRMTVRSSVSIVHPSPIRVILFPVSMLILAVYPASLLESIPGGIFSAVLGMMVLFISTWALGTAIFSQHEMEFEDVLDDFTSIYRKIQPRVKFIPRLEDFAKIDWLRRLFSWLNPRQHKWNLIILIALLMGGLLMGAEALREGMSTNANMVLLILAIFVGIEGAGVVLGYFLFGEFLGIFRKN